ncbi:cytochrome P450 [Cellulomonas carbonis]|uniref:Cytochrome P450 n=1 Tax=Cellulomonas carbonis T26 TaxID=947969 RepID=A0A0A0BQ54_9CELL|nr:cytochrome P450 [Cellulomonas carbonis]KGM10618.1 cytochrome P450 [Cellulomonas carbonis T26]GGC07138.1 cytochrome P450 [Cellulomonas carbonis]
MTEHTPSDELSADDHLRGGAPVRDDGGTPPPPDWNPRGPRVRRDPVAAYDELRSRCPVAHGPDGAWTVFSHHDVMAVALDHTTYSNAVSRHLQVPNGMDGAEHSAYRAVVDRYFTPERVRAAEPVIRRVATELVAAVDVPGPVDAVTVGARFAVRAQSAWLGWPTSLEEELLDWVEDNRSATRSRDRARTAAVAQRFTAIIRSLTDARRDAGDDAPDDVTTELVRDRVDGRPLTDEEIVSVLRNWTGGDLASMALCAGVVLTYLADHPDLQARLRAGVPDRELDRVLDEILRIDDPFVSNRRIATEPVTLGGRHVAAGDQVIVNWTAANRDPRVFGDPDAFDPEANAPYNLVWGIGKHVCPGRPLATLELRALTRAVLAATTAVEPDPDRPRERERPPAGGFVSAPLLLR